MVSSPIVSSRPPTLSPAPRHTSFQSRPSRLTSTVTASPLPLTSKSQSSLTPHYLTTRSPIDSFHPAAQSINSVSLPQIAPRLSAALTAVPIQSNKPARLTYSAPNYNISLAPAPLFSTPANSLAMMTAAPLAPQQPIATPTFPVMGGMLTPSRPTQSTAKSSGTLSKDDWASFDPLS